MGQTANTASDVHFPGPQTPLSEPLIKSDVVWEAKAGQSFSQNTEGVMVWFYFAGKGWEIFCGG